MSELTNQDRKDLSKALSYAHFSFIGIFIPIIGWFLAGMALSFVKTIPDTKESERRIRQVKKAAWWGIILSCLAVAAGVGYYKYSQSQEDKQLNNAQQTINETVNSDEMRENRAKAGLQNCLDEALNTYNDGFAKESQQLGFTDGTLPQANATRWDTIYKESKDECYNQYDAGLFDDYISFDQ